MPARNPLPRTLSTRLARLTTPLDNPFAVTSPMQVDGDAADDLLVGVAVELKIHPGFGVPPYTFSLPAGPLPDGLALAAHNAWITGTPTRAGAYPGIVIRIADTSTDWIDFGPFDLLVRD